MFRELCVDGHQVFEVSVLGQSLTIQIFHALDDLRLISPTFSFIRTSTGNLPSRNPANVGTHSGKRVSRARPAQRGFDFSHDFSSGFSDHRRRRRIGSNTFKREKMAQRPCSGNVTAFSTYLIGL